MVMIQLNLYSQESCELIRDLQTVERIDQELNYQVPVTYNSFLQGGYINMPTARMGEEGEVGIGFSYVPPYHNYNVRCQPLSFLEITGNYRVFTGIPDPVFGSLGFGDYSDKGLNVKFGFRPEDSDYKWPGLVLGFDDILGTRSFRSTYIVATQVFKQFNFNISLGYGFDRIHKLYGGIEWMPFYNCYALPLFRTLSFVTEYDATNYTNPVREPHPDGRDRKTHWNIGLKYRIFDYFDLTTSYVRGHKFSFAVSAFYNFGDTEGFVPKKDDPLPYCYPTNNECIHPTFRPHHILAQEFNFALRDQGFLLMDMWLEHMTCKGKILRLKIYNEKWPTEPQVREHLNDIVSNLTPADIDFVYVVIEGEGFPVQEYHYNMIFVREYEACRINSCALAMLTPICELTQPDPCLSEKIFTHARDYIELLLLPRTYTAFGSATGKFKYSLGVTLGVKGFLYYDLYYEVLVGKDLVSQLHGLNDVDVLNPSQLINVKTCYTNYYKFNGFSIDKAFVQKIWNYGKGFYFRTAGGYFDIVYGGAAFEAIYCPIDSPWAIGFEYDMFWKRPVGGLKFTNHIRKLNGYIPTIVPYHGRQYYLDLYYSWRCPQIDFRLSVGQFMAFDYGVRYEVGKTFESGLRLYIWYTTTNAHDILNGHVYYDKGIGFSMPLDVFYTHSSRDRWGYKISAWQRDCGYRAPSGKRLYDIIQEQRIE
jgi:hypothetical protein